MSSALDKILDPKFQAKQAKYENARIAIDRGYSLATHVYKGTDVKEYATLARQIASEFAKDLDMTTALLD